MDMRAGFAAAAVALAAAIGPAPVPAATATPATLDLQTRQYDPMQAGEYDGRLRLRIGAGGTVSGWFMNTEGAITTVTGGIDGTTIWIDLAAGSPSLLRFFRGTLVEGKLQATAPHGIDTWILEGKPVAR
jgi:hypothetical protein